MEPVNCMEPMDSKAKSKSVALPNAPNFYGYLSDRPYILQFFNI